MGEANRRKLAAQQESDRQDNLIRQAFKHAIRCIDHFPNKPISALSNIYGGRNATLKKMDSVLDKTQIACSIECSACCYQLVLCSPFEVLNIAKIILDTWEHDELEALDISLNAIGHLPRTTKARYGKHAPCPLLKNRKCSIYDQRPLPCRVLYSNSRRQCENCLEGGDGDIEFLADPKVTSSAMTLGINSAIHKRLQLNLEMVELSGSLHTALLDFDSVASAWLSGKNPFKKYQIKNSHKTMSNMADLMIKKLELN